MRQGRPEETGSSRGKKQARTMLQRRHGGRRGDQRRRGK